MNFIYDSANDLIQINSLSMLLFYSDPNRYNEVEVKIKYNNGEETTYTYGPTEPIDTSGDIYMSGEYTVFTPAAFGMTEFQEGVYSIIMLFKGDAIIVERYCGFVDKGIGCDIYDFYSSEAKAELKYKAATIYYLLKTPDTCPCECDKLAELYLYLADLVDKNCISC